MAATVWIPAFAGMTGKKSGMTGVEIEEIRPISPARIVLILKSDLTRANSLRYIIIAAYFGRRSKLKKFQ